MDVYGNCIFGCFVAVVHSSKVYQFVFYNILICKMQYCIFFDFRAAPDDWESGHPCDQDPEEVENIWELTNCFWLTVGSIMGQGCDLLPK